MYQEKWTRRSGVQVVARYIAIPTLPISARKQALIVHAGLVRSSPPCVHAEPPPATRPRRFVARPHLSRSARSISARISSAVTACQTHDREMQIHQDRPQRDQL